MPIVAPANIRRLTQEEFGEISYEVMQAALAIQNEMGRLFHEDIYRETLHKQLPQSKTEVRVQVRFEDFVKEYRLDLLVCGGAPFELKAVRRMTSPHRQQMLNYLLLTELSHGKLINFGSESVEHEFVNTHLSLADRTAFDVINDCWRAPQSPKGELTPWLVNFLRDVGACLDVELYQSAVNHFFRVDETDLTETAILSNGTQIGKQHLPLVSPDWGIKVTTLDEVGRSNFEGHLKRFLRHTTLLGIHWINIRRDKVVFSSIDRLQ